MRKQKAAAAITCLSFLFFSSIEGQITGSLPTCSSSCGELRNISYPFRLRRDPNNCGDSDYQLNCDDNKAMLAIHSAEYYVEEISYNQQKIRLVDTAFVNVNCSLPKNSLSADEIDGDKRFLDGTFAWASFVSCSKAIEDPKYTPVPCANRMNENVYVIYNEFSRSISFMKESCTFLAVVPAERRSVAGSSFTAIWKILQMGFELEWSIPCRDCRLNGGTCNTQFKIDGCLHLQGSE